MSRIAWSVAVLAVALGAQEPVVESKVVDTPATSNGATEVYKRIGDVELTMQLVTPAGHTATDRRPAVVFFFGGGWTQGRIDQFRPQAEYLASRGMVAALADYRVRSRHGTTPFECVADGKSAVRWLRANSERLGIDARRIAAGGGSAGGHVAAATGVLPGLDEVGEDTEVSARPDALLLFNPVFDNGPTGYGHDRVKARWREISPLHNLGEGAPPTIVFLGTKDSLIPVATARDYEQRMKKAGARCDLHLYEGEPHGFFNRERSARSYALTVREMDRFLVSLGWLDGEPTIEVPEQKPAPKPAAKPAKSGG
ncbi:MAG: alpha/beta hydrolase [Planctomycetota bacterium]